MWRSIAIKLEESKEGIQRGYTLRHTSEEDTITAAGGSHIDAQNVFEIGIKLVETCNEF